MTELIEGEVMKLNQLAHGLYNAGQYMDAHVAAENAVALARAHFPSEPLMAMALGNLASIDMKLARWNEADAGYLEMLTIIEAAAPTDPMIGSVLHGRGLLRSLQGRLAEARTLIERAVEHFRHFGEPEDGFLATALKALGDTSRRLGLLCLSESALEESRELRKALGGTEDRAYASVQWSIANLRRDEGRFAEAETLYMDALADLNHAFPTGHPDIAEITSNLTVLHLAAGRYANALEQGEKARELAKRFPQVYNTLMPLALIDLAAVHHVMGSYSVAEPLYQQALEILRATTGSTTTVVAGALVNLAHLRRETGDYASSRRYLAEALQIFSDCNLDSHPDLAKALSGVVATERASGNADAMRDASRKVLAILERSLGDRHPDVMTARSSLGQVEMELGDLAQADLRLRASLLPAGTPGSDHPSQGAAWRNFGHLLLARGKLDEAERAFRRALAIREQSMGTSHPAIADCLDSIAHCCAGSGRWDEAIDLQARAFDMRSHALGEVFVIGSERQRLAHVHELQGDLHGLLAMIMRSASRSPDRILLAANAVLRRKAIAAEALSVQRDAILGGRYPHLATQLQQLRGLRTQIAALTRERKGEDRIKAHEGAIDGLLQERERLERALALNIPEIALDGRLRAASGETVAAALISGYALVELIVYRDRDFRALLGRDDSGWRPPRVLAFVIPSVHDHSSIAMLDLGDAASVNRLVAEAFAGRRTSGTRDLVPPGTPSVATDVEAAAQALRERVWAPIARALGACTHVLLSLDGDLVRVPFGALPADDATALLDHFTFTYLSAGRDVLRFADRPRAYTPSLVIGDPDYDAWGSAATNLHSAHFFERLPYSASEAELVSAALGVAPVVRADAVESLVKAVRSPQVLHLATHGFFEPLRNAARPPTGATAAEANGAMTSRQLVPPEVENPLLRSGIALAGANTWLAGGDIPPHAEDGLLYAEDVTGLDLSDTELVVLSACKTGLGEIDPGEGVHGLQRSFAIAGARTVVMSMWPVPDRQTKELMAAFYRGLVSGLACTEALRAAQLELRAAYPDVAYWGAFVCQGDPRPISSP